MIDLSTTYLGLQLDNPLVPSASPLSRSLDTARRLEDAGAGALVMYSLFEEELRQEDESLARFLLQQDIGFGEAQSFIPFHSEYKRGLDHYLEQLAALKEHLSIPVIASLNGVTLSGWIEHGRELEAAGADALELNVYYIAADMSEPGNLIEARYLQLLRELRTQVDLPVAMKLSPYFSSVPHFIRHLQEAGANGVALFNRFYQPDIDLELLRVVPQLHLSGSADGLLAMRWIAILFGRVELSLAATGGVHTAEDVVKMLLAGADVTHLCSALLRHGPDYLATVKQGLEQWLERSEYDSVAEIKGIISQLNARDPVAFERANYVAVLDSFTPSRGVHR
ncbi:MAG: dihydroorotate dehydrogenase-like protein [Gammaproteobacteria bacterium]